MIVAGLLLNALFLVGSAVFADVHAAAIAGMVGIGLVGITLNLATMTRVQTGGQHGIARPDRALVLHHK
ncbi:hypothetical protein ABZ816_37065 [Actinosynnema sp. NPDC047251]|uniref:hypothetical protein n=1 Tax=Saccharothrix espanaensis TaxID=103731 RepID=UPI00059E96D3|nr:hypothetical protein [Saccharothrix espanaensis]